ncbi:hypothetical protein JDFnp1_154 [Fusobacterium phage JD-Fnp1]|nr:hypothetical protein JDFnp1_154 [Fusobacterium phage JD-Fnp1]
MKKVTKEIVRKFNERIMNLDIEKDYDDFMKDWKDIQAEESEYEREAFVKYRKELLSANDYVKKAFNQKLSKIIKRAILNIWEDSNEE